MCHDKAFEVKEGYGMKETWKDISGFEGLYQVSNTGKIKSFCRKKTKILVPGIHRGYERVILSKNNIRRYASVHRLVAEAFVPNPEGKPQVNHIDENTRNNNANNLEWVTSKENINWGTGLERRSYHQRSTQPRCKAVYQYDRSLNLINIFSSCHEAARQTGYLRSGIAHSCNKKRGFKTYKGYVWEYETKEG